MTRTSRCRGATIVATLLSLGTLSCTSSRPPSAVARSPSAQAPKEVLPADLDVALWLDIARLRGLWTLQPDRRIAHILAGYGLYVATSETREADFWLDLVRHSDRWWIGCRPTHDGCVDAVVFARGRFSDCDPGQTLPGMARPIDLGAGWFRYDRRTRVARHQVARIYVAPPDRMVVVAPAEVDAVERSLERGHADRSLFPEERGFFSLAFRGRAMARLVERRAPAAARFLRDAVVVKLWLEGNSDALDFTIVASFANHGLAEHARLVFSLVAPTLNLFDTKDPSNSVATDVVGGDLVLHVRVHAGSESTTPEEGGAAPKDPNEPAAQ
jgi:hypothetical protein